MLRGSGCGTRSLHNSSGSSSGYRLCSCVWPAPVSVVPGAACQTSSIPSIIWGSPNKRMHLTKREGRWHDASFFSESRFAGDPQCWADVEVAMWDEVFEEYWAARGTKGGTPRCQAAVKAGRALLQQRGRERYDWLRRSLRDEQRKWFAAAVLESQTVPK